MFVEVLSSERKFICLLKLLGVLAQGISQMYSCSLFHHSESQILEVEPIRSASYVDICQLCAAVTISKENAAPGSTASLFKTPGKPFCFFSAELVNVFALSAGSPDR